ncbi:MAG: hypothetical protein PHI53_02355 [Candidatus Pacebacteria bacterium]|nr:hypothetical protein [Candidatus Paceibacterota bacterium]
MKKPIYIVIILGVILALAGFWYWGRNIYSKDLLKLEVLGPEEASILDEVEYTVKYKNNGDIRLEEPTLIFEFPKYSLVSDLSEENVSEGLVKRIEIGPDKLGDIYPGEEKTFKFKGRLLGSEGELKTIKVWLSYKPKNLKASYESSTTFTTKIKSIPITFDIDIPSKSEAGRDFTFSLNYFSRVEYPLSNLGIKIEYPQGFEFMQSSPRALGSSEWEIPILNKAEGGRIEISGRLMGEIKDQKIFKAQLGMWFDGEFLLLKNLVKGLEIDNPQIYVFQRINGSDKYIAKPNDVLHYEVFFRNISNEPFNNLFLVVRLDGKGFNFNSVRTDNGQFSQGDNSVIWDWRQVPKLQFLAQGEEGKVEFWIDLKDWSVSSSQEKNYVLKDSVLISQLKQEFETKVSSKLEISQKAYYQDEVFGNSGPNPPNMSETTTYTIIWQLKNYYNDVKNVKVKATLPQDVRLTGRFFPEEESQRITFDTQSREIVWNVKSGNVLESGTGVLGDGPSIAFQVAVTPSNSSGYQTQLVGPARISGDDLWTGADVENTSSGLNIPN